MASEQENGSWLRLAGKTALVTGGTRNIGRAIAEGFAEAGANVAVIGGSDHDALQETLAALAAYDVRSTGVVQGVGEAAGLQEAYRTITAEIGEIDIVANVAATRPKVPTPEITVENWEEVMNVNVRSHLLLAQAALPGMQERGFGRIINFSGMNFYWGRQSRTHVVTSKGAVVALTRALAYENARLGVTVNTLVPGSIGTVRQHPEWFPEPEKSRERQMDRVPMGRLGTTEEVVSTTLFLASPRAAYITGQEIFVTGGAHPLVHN